MSREVMQFDFPVLRRRVMFGDIFQGKECIL